MFSYFSIFSSRIDSFWLNSFFKYPFRGMLMFLRSVIMILLIILIFVSFSPLHIQIPQMNNGLNQKENDNNY